MVVNTKERTVEFTISFDSANLEKVDGGYYIHSASIHLARKRQHRHENPSAAKRRTRKQKKQSLKEYLKLRYKW